MRLDMGIYENSSGMKPDRAVGEENPNHVMMIFDVRRLDEDGMRLVAGIYEISSDNEKRVGTMNFNIEKRFYAERSGNCENSANGKKNMKRLYVRESYNYEISSDSKKLYNSEKISYAGEMLDCKNSSGSKRIFDNEKRSYVEGIFDCERMGNACSSSCDGGGSGPAQTTMLRRGGVARSSEAATTASRAATAKGQIQRQWIEVTMQPANTATSEKLFSASSGFSMKAKVWITAEETVESAPLSRRSVGKNDQGMKLQTFLQFY